MPPKLTKTSAAVKLLKTKLRSGKITSSHTPVEVWKSDPVLRQDKLPTFRTRFHKLRKEVQNGMDEGAEREEEEDLDRRCTIGENSKKRICIDAEAAETDEEDDELHVDIDTKETVLSDTHQFRPFYLLSEWEEPQTRTPRISIAVFLPSSIGSGDFSVSVVDGGTCVELKVQWPDPLVNVQLLHREWLTTNDGFEKIEMYHPKICGFEKSLMHLRQGALEGVESSTRIPLPFPVETHIVEKNNLAWRESTIRIVYLDLKAAIPRYAVQKENEAFQVV